ncbi:MAG TPA: heliorhodopsin HeR [Patescibacteria group bacterium]|jgi:succinate dehydrogenase/fumarate reductase cytochrome b subunit
MAGKLEKLQRFNLTMAGLHALQGIVIWVLATDFSLPLNLGFLQFDPTSQSLVPAAKAIADVPLAALVVAFLFMSAVAHLVVATVGRRRYERGLRKGINRFRWVEYAFSASTMMVAVAMLVGIYDAAALALIFLAVAVMNLCGLVMEVRDQDAARTDWLPFWVGCAAGIGPWIAVALYLASGAAYGSKAPDFVYWIFVSIFVFFNCFAINMVLQYKKAGKWREYLYGERAYVLLSLFAKSALAWQVFAGTLRP